MSAFDDLKSDVQTLIDTASSSILQLIDQAQRTSASVPVSSSVDPAAAFNSQLVELSSKVRSATDSLRSQVAAVLQQSQSSGSSGTSSSSGSADTSSSSSSSASGSTPVPASPPQASPTDGSNQSGSVTVSPDSFKAAG